MEKKGEGVNVVNINTPPFILPMMTINTSLN